MKWKTSLSAASNARKVLPQLAEEYFEAGRKAANGKGSAKALHRFRIATKRFRYALELFEPVYGASMDRHLKALQKLQNSLGKISDYQTILEILDDDKAVEAKILRSIKRKTKGFRRQWNEFDSNGQLKHWKDYLGHTSRREPGRAGKPSQPAAGRVA